MATQKITKVITKRKKFIEVDIPLIKTKIELIGTAQKELENKTIKLDLTRQLKGKSLEAVFIVKLENNKLSAYPKKIKLMPYFIRRMIRKRISYVEDSFETPSQESLLIIKPFLITRKRVSRIIRKILRNKAKNWIEDYIAGKKDNEIFAEILSNRLQRALSLVLKKTYPLSLCEIRILEIKRVLKPEEIPKIKEKPKEETEKLEETGIIDQLEEIEQEKIRQAEKEIKETQEKAAEIEKLEEEKEPEETQEKAAKTKAKKKKAAKPRKKKSETEEI